jgi:hypothetical protein
MQGVGRVIEEVEMQPSEIRKELFEQHAHLRAQSAAIRAAADRCLRGEDALPDLRLGLLELTDALHVHNAREAELMSAVFPDLDAWAPTRKEVMNDEHIAEHAAAEATLILALVEPDAFEAATAALQTLTELLAHMDREEKVFLTTDVLSDDVVPDAFGG